MIRTFGITAITLGTLAFANISPANAAEVTLKTKSSDKYGSYVTDSAGRALYLSKTDRPAAGMVTPKSSCYDACAKAWPPLIVDGDPKAGEGIDNKMVGRVARKDGKQQVTYNGWPLYYFSKDQGPGKTAGQDAKGFGTEWYLVTPKGNEVHAMEKK